MGDGECGVVSSTKTCRASNSDEIRSGLDIFPCWIEGVFQSLRVSRSEMVVGKAGLEQALIDGGRWGRGREEEGRKPLKNAPLTSPF